MSEEILAWVLLNEQPTQVRVVETFEDFDEDYTDILCTVVTEKGRRYTISNKELFFSREDLELYKRKY